MSGYGYTSDFEPFGKLYGSYSTPLNRLRFIGKEKDVESGASDFGARKYDAGSGRFMSVDPLWAAYPGQSPYGYSANNPLVMSDPSGMSYRDFNAESNPLDPKTPKSSTVIKTLPSLVFDGDHAHGTVGDALWRSQGLRTSPRQDIDVSTASFGIGDNPLTIFIPPPGFGPLVALIPVGIEYDRNESIADGRTRDIAFGPAQRIVVRGHGVITIGGVHLRAERARTRDDESTQRAMIVRALRNSPLDAMRHAFASALTARRWGAEDVIVLGQLHEWWERNENRPAETRMDNYNNMIGARIGAAHPNASNDEIWDLILQALSDGLLQINENEPIR